jgi:glycosidase
MKGSKEMGDAEIRHDFPGGWGTEDKHSAFYSNEDANKNLGIPGRTETEEAYFQFTKELLNWRKTQPVIHVGKFKQFVPENNVYVYFRYDEQETIMVVLNNSTKEESIHLSRFQEVLKGKKIFKNVLTNEFVNIDSQKLILSPKTATIYRVN